MNKFWLIVLAFLLSACATPKQTFVPASASAEKGSVVYVYRTAEVSSLMLPPELSFVSGDGSAAIKVGKLANGEYRQLYVKPGIYKVQVDAIDYYAPGNSVSFEAKPASVSYLRLDSSLKFETGVRYKSYQRSFDVKPVEASVAIDELAACVDIQSRPKQAQTPRRPKKDLLSNDEDAHFSTDKTADPFSRH